MRPVSIHGLGYKFLPAERRAAGGCGFLINYGPCSAYAASNWLGVCIVANPIAVLQI